MDDNSEKFKHGELINEFIYHFDRIYGQVLNIIKKTIKVQKNTHFKELPELKIVDLKIFKFIAISESEEKVILINNLRELVPNMGILIIGTFKFNENEIKYEIKATINSENVFIVKKWEIDTFDIYPNDLINEESLNPNYIKFIETLGSLIANILTMVFDSLISHRKTLNFDKKNEDF